MALQYSVPVRNAQLDQVEVVTGPSALFRFYTGAPPANCAAAATGTLLVEISLPADYFNDAAGGSKTKKGTWSGSAVATGAAGYFRMYDATGTTCHVQGTVTQTGGGGDVTLDNNSIAINQQITSNTFQLNAANA